MPTAARRWLSRSVSGWPIRQASKKSAAQATASAISASRTVCEGGEVGDQPERELVVHRPPPAGSRPRRSAARTRSAARPGPTRRLPQASCALPGSTSVIAISAERAPEPHPRGASSAGGSLGCTGGVRRTAVGRPWPGSVAPEGKIRCARPVSPVTGVTSVHDAPVGRGSTAKRVASMAATSSSVGGGRRTPAGSRRGRGWAGPGPATPAACRAARRYAARRCCARSR